MLGQKGNAAASPDSSRLVEGVCHKMCRIHTSPVKTGRTSTTRWTLILADYERISELISSNHQVTSKTSLQLFQINTKTLSQW